MTMLTPQEINAVDDVHNGWNEWSRYVLNELVKLTGRQESQSEKIEKHEIEIAKLKLKFSIYATVAAFVGSIIVNLIIHYIK